MSFPRTGNVSLSGLNAARPLSQPRTPTSGLTSTSTIHQNIHSAPGTTNNVLTLQQRDHMVQLKEAQICTKVAQKVAHSSFIGKVLAHKMAQKIAKYLGYLFKKIFHQDLSKIAQSMELFSRRRRTNGLAQKSNKYGMLPCM